MEPERFFADLTARLDELRETNRMEYQRFFDGLAPRLDTARALERELDRNLALRFNVLDYLRDDELGLSRIIADLLDPEASHGQGTLFLRTLLERLKSLNRFDTGGALDRSRITVKVERRTPAGRQIDVSVQIGGDDGETHCLAIENKPYAGDRKNQVKDYLEYLEEEYDDRFLLIYLPPTGEGPSEWSIDREELTKEEWKDRFAIMPYHRGQEEQADGFEAFRIPYSLAEWLGECRKNCEVDRLRWFLRDAETFCQRTFGGQAMTTDSETEAVLDFVLSDPNKLRNLKVMHDSWPAARDDVCKRFLEQLRSRIEKADKLKKFAHDMHVLCEYDGESRYSCGVWLYRECWTPYSEAQSKDGRTSIGLNAKGPGPNGWYIVYALQWTRTTWRKKSRNGESVLMKSLRTSLILAEVPPGGHDSIGWMRTKGIGIHSS